MIAVRPSGTRLTLLSIVFVLSAVLLVLTALACSTNQSVRSTGGGGLRVSDVVYFDDFAELVATADVVAVGQVAEVLAGDIDQAGTPDEVRHTNAVLQITDVFAGELDAETVTVETLELAYSRPHTEWRTTGTTVIAFLTMSREGRAIYITTNHSQSIYVVTAEDLDLTVRDPLGAEVASWTLSRFRQEVAEANEKIARGEVRAQTRER
jgi:hypothetical protein